MFEPMVIGIIFPFLNRAPWQVRSTPQIHTSDPHIKCSQWRGNCGKCGKSWMWLLDHERIQSLRVDVVRHEEALFPIKERAIDVEKKRNEPKERQWLIAAWRRRHRLSNQYKNGQDGDHVLVSFECDSCIFRKLRGHTPDPLASSNTLLRACIWRVNLDAFWSQDAATIKGNKDKLTEGLQMSEAVCLEGPYE
jgi:hypothetical protein